MVFRIVFTPISLAIFIQWVQRGSSCWKDCPQLPQTPDSKERGVPSRLTSRPIRAIHVTSAPHIYRIILNQEQNPHYLSLYLPIFHIFEFLIDKPCKRKSQSRLHLSTISLKGAYSHLLYSFKCFRYYHIYRTLHDYKFCLWHWKLFKVL